MKRRLIWIAVAALLIVAFAGYRMFTKATPDAVKADPDVVITATDILRAFEQNSVAADKQYAGKIIKVSGTVKSIDNTGAVVLGADAAASEVVVGLAQHHIEDLKKIKAGAQATLQGAYSGYENSNGDDLLSGLGTTVQLRSGGLKKMGDE